MIALQGQIDLEVNEKVYVRGNDLKLRIFLLTTISLALLRR